jgi:hypothetical protein
MLIALDEGLRHFTFRILHFTFQRSLAVPDITVKVFNSAKLF